MANDLSPLRQTVQRLILEPQTSHQATMNNALVSRFTVLIERAATALADWLLGAPPAAAAAGLRLSAPRARS
jgi:hypothetical protein